MTTLLERIDLACEHAGKTRGDLARALGVSVQSISNMKRKGPQAGMRTENVARAARFLGCDVYWLCTGDPEDYVPALTGSAPAQEAAALINRMDTEMQESALAKVYLLWRTTNYDQALETAIKKTKKATRAVPTKASAPPTPPAKPAVKRRA